MSTKERTFGLYIQIPRQKTTQAVHLYSTSFFTYRNIDTLIWGRERHLDQGGVKMETNHQGKLTQLKTQEDTAVNTIS